MAVEKRLAYSIVQFLRDQTHRGTLNSDEQESLEGRSPSCLKHLKTRGFLLLGWLFRFSSLSDQSTENYCAYLFNDIIIITDIYMIYTSWVIFGEIIGMTW